MAPFVDKIETLRQLQREFQSHTGVRDYSAKDGVSPGICHQVAREQFIEPGRLRSRRPTATPAWAAATTRCLGRRRHRVRRPDPLRLHAGRGARVDPLRARRRAAPPACTAKDLMLLILLDLRARRADAQPRDGVRRPGLATPLDGRARDAGQHGHRVLRARRHRRGGRGDASEWIAERRPGVDVATLARARRRARSRRRLRRRRARDRPRRDPADGRASRRSRPRHPLRPDQRRLHRRDRRREDRHRLRGVVHRRQDRRPRDVRAGAEGGGRRGPEGRRGRALLHPVRLDRGRGALRARAA